MPELISDSTLLRLPPHAQADALLLEWERRTQSAGPAYVQARPNLLLRLRRVCDWLHHATTLNADAEDVRTVLADCSRFSMDDAECSEPGRALTAATAVLMSLAPRWAVARPARRVLLGIKSPVLAPLQMGELTQITDLIRYALGNDAELIFGHGETADPANGPLKLLLLVGYA